LIDPNRERLSSGSWFAPRVQGPGLARSRGRCSSASKVVLVERI